MLDAIAYHAGRTLVAAGTRLALDMDVVRHADWPDGPFVVAANHPTTLDPFLLPTLVPRRLTLLVTDMAFGHPVLGAYLRMVGHVPVATGRGRAAFDEALASLRRGRSVGIFPEGALTPLDGRSSPPRTGAVRLALAAGVPVVPVGLAVDPGAIRFRETTVCGRTETARWYPRGPYAVTIGAPMLLGGALDDHDRVRAVAASVMLRIGALAAESASRFGPDRAGASAVAVGVRYGAAG